MLQYWFIVTSLCAVHSIVTLSLLFIYVHLTAFISMLFWCFMYDLDGFRWLENWMQRSSQDGCRLVACVDLYWEQQEEEEEDYDDEERLLQRHSLPGWASKNLLCVNTQGDVLAQFLWSALLLSTDVRQRKHTRSPKPFHYVHSNPALGSSLMKTSDETKNCQCLKQQHGLKRCQSSMSLLVRIFCV